MKNVMKKILVIDDAEFILESTMTLLKFEGYDVVTATNGLEGVEAAKENEPDLILCDISMPELDGYGVLEAIRANPLTETTPFIFLTAFSEKKNMRMGMEKGADDYLVKPFNREELIAAINTQWKKSSVYEKQVQEKLDEVGHNISNALPHEFRTVLNQVVGSAKYLSQNSENIQANEINELSEDIISSSKRLLRITENYLIYSRILYFSSSPAKRQQILQYTTHEPSAIILDIANQNAEKLERSGDMDFGEMVDNIAVSISTESFHKIIDELVDNALKFSTLNSKVKIKTVKDTKNFVITIEDEGRGMTKQQIEGIGAYIQFERTMHEQQGIGLGLVIAKRLTELHNGIFKIESKVDVGTKVSVSLPYKENSYL